VDLPWWQDVQGLGILNLSVRASAISSGKASQLGGPSPIQDGSNDRPDKYEDEKRRWDQFQDSHFRSLSMVGVR
jgi:hypothetical protein